MRHTIFSCLVGLLFSMTVMAQSADEYLDKAKDYLLHWQPDDAITALDQCAEMSASDTAMLMTCLDYKAAAWCEKGDVWFFNDFGRQARDLWDEWQPDSEATIPWISTSVDRCLEQIINWCSDQDETEQQRVREQARQMMARTFGENSEHYQSWLQMNQ